MLHLLELEHGVFLKENFSNVCFAEVQLHFFISYLFYGVLGNLY